MKTNTKVDTEMSNIKYLTYLTYKKFEYALKIEDKIKSFTLFSFHIV